MGRESSALFVVLLHQLVWISVCRSYTSVPVGLAAFPKFGALLLTAQVVCESRIQWG
jgi:hypothetical protein